MPSQGQLNPLFELCMFLSIQPTCMSSYILNSMCQTVPIVLKKHFDSSFNLMHLKDPETESIKLKNHQQMHH